MSRWSVPILVTAIVAAVLLAATPPSSAAPPTLSILSPADGAVVGFGAPAEITVQVTDFNLTAPGAPPTTGQGHIEVSVDGAAVLLAERVSFSVPLQPGPHVILLRLVGNDGVAPLPEVTATLRVTATRGPSTGTPSIVITYPPEGLRRGIDTGISFRVSDFALVAPGGPAAVHEGHVHVLLDGVLYEERWDSAAIQFSDLSEDDHEVTFRLVDSLEAPLTPDVSATVHFTAADRGTFDPLPLQIAAGVLAFMLLLVLVLPVRRRQA